MTLWKRSATTLYGFTLVGEDTRKKKTEEAEKTLRPAWSIQAGTMNHVGDDTQKLFFQTQLQACTGMPAGGAFCNGKRNGTNVVRVVLCEMLLLSRGNDRG